MRKIITPLITLIIVFSIAGKANAQNELLQSGPMVGYSTMREVAIWVQTKEAATVSIRYIVEGTEEDYKYSEDVSTEKSSGYTAKIIIGNLKPGTKYSYEVLLNDEPQEFTYPLRFQTQELWQWRGDPPGIKFAFGSCFYVNEEEFDRPGKPYGDNFEILDVLYDQSPEFMLWMGDNVYLREADWNSRSGIMHRYTHTRSYPKLQKLLGSVHNYATWDDHDYGPDNSNRSFWNKQTTLEIFKLFWANPSFGLKGNGGMTTKFQWADVDFFLMDDRTFRSPEKRRLTAKREILGDVQIDWLIDNLISSEAPFKFVVIGTQFLNPNASGENHASYKEERKKILDMIESENIEGVMFLTGDVHRSEITKLERSGSYPLYEFTISPLTAGVSWQYPNDDRVDNKSVLERNFGLIEISGPRDGRKLTCKSISWDGRVMWDYTIYETDLKLQ